MSRIQLVLLLLLFATPGLSNQEQSDSFPDWFPEVSCAEAWQSRRGTPYNFDYGRFGEYEQGELGDRYQDFIEYSLSRNSTPRSECFKKWTVIVVMDAAEDLYPFSLWDLYEMETAYSNRVNGSTFRKDVLVQHHGFDEDFVRRFHMFQSPRRYQDNRVQRDFLPGGELGSVELVHSPVIETKSVLREDFDEKVERFVDFVTWSMREYPSEHYMVVYWGHGQGWLTGIEIKNAHLSGEELREALSLIQTSPEGLQGKKKIDNFVADACYMQSVELVTELSPFARFVSGSAEVQTFLGLPYRTLLSEMNSGFRAVKRESRHLPAQKVVKVHSEESRDEPAMMAKLLPVLVSQTLADGGFANRIDLAMQEAGYSSLGDSRRFTFSTIETETLVEDLLPSLEFLAEAALQFVNEDEGKRTERANLFVDKIWLARSFKSMNETREIGSMVELWRGLDPNLDLMIDGVHRALENSVVLSLEGEKAEDPSIFQSINVWFPKRERDMLDEIEQFDHLVGVKLENKELNVFGDLNSNWMTLIQLILNEAG